MILSRWRQSISCRWSGRAAVAATDRISCPRVNVIACQHTAAAPPEGVPPLAPPDLHSSASKAKKTVWRGPTFKNANESASNSDSVGRKMTGVDAATILNLIQTAADDNKPQRVLKFVQIAHHEHIDLTWKECMIGLTQLYKHAERPTPAHSHQYIRNLLEFLMRQLKALNFMNHEAYMCAMKIYRELHDSQSAYVLMTEFTERGDVPLTEQLQAEYTKAIATAALKSPGDSTDPHPINLAQRWFFVKITVRSYETYLSMRSTSQFSADRDVYIAAARAHGVLLSGRTPSSASAVIAVFEAMARDGFEPDASICRFVLSKALLAQNASVTQVMMQWFLQHFDYPLEAGAISEVLNIAARENDMDLAKIALRTREKAFYINNENSVTTQKDADVGTNGVTPFDYATMLSIAVNSKDVTAAVEVLQEAEDVGIDLGNFAYGITVLEKFTIFCSHSIVMLDALYYALVDMSRLSSGGKVPKYALTTVVSAAGRMGQNDRAFATFIEYVNLFGLKHDIHSYNALLAAMARHNTPRVLPLLKILQEMESLGIKPNSTSFMYLIEVMTESGDMSSLPAALKMMEDRQITVRGRTLRRAAYRAVDDRNDELLVQLKKAMASKNRFQEHPDNLHHFFKVYIDKRVSQRKAKENRN